MKYFYFLLFIFSSFFAHSQSKVSGQIKDEFGDPIAYANVFFKDSNDGTITNENGRFYLETYETHSFVVFSFVGYKTLEIELKENKNISSKVI